MAQANNSSRSATTDDAAQTGTAGAVSNPYAPHNGIFPDLTGPMDDATWRNLRNNAEAASDFLKAISHEGRLMILCALANGEKSVTEIEHLLSSRQSAVSQQLARLRTEGLVTARRDGKQIFYSLTDDRARRIIEQVYAMFCS